MLSHPWIDRILPRTKLSATGEHSRLLAASESSLEGLFLLEPHRDEAGDVLDLRFDYLNAAAEALLGSSRTHLLGRHLSEVSLPSLPPGLFDQCRTAFETGRPHMEELARDSAGGTGWVRYRIARTADILSVTLVDISADKAREELYRGLAEFNDTVFESASCGIIATDEDGTITAMNRAAESLTGYNREDLVGKAPLTHFHDRKELAQRAKNLDLPHLPSMEGFDILTALAGEQDWTYRRPDGRAVPVNVCLRALKTHSGEITGFVAIAFDIAERRAMMDYVTHLATHDQLTGLLGRAVLQDRIVQAVERARRYGTKVAIFILDLDQFKRINDSLGHWAGDQVLLETTERLRGAVRSADTIARMGGDEFVVVMEDITSITDVEQCANTLVNRFSPEMLVEGNQLHVSASVGVCVYPDFAGDARHLLKWADAAMHAAKESGRSQFQIFNESMLRETVDRLSMERSLRHSVANRELRVFFQPQICLTTGAVIGMEALLRWEHPTLGLLPPAQFMPLAEDTGLILSIGEWAFTTACCEGKKIRDDLGTDLTVAINLSPRQFQQKNLLEIVERSLRESDLPPTSLEIEITEDTLMVNSPDILQKLGRLRELGVRIAIDDFGTGFCNFNYLIEYEVDRLKIDQSFVRLSSTEANAAAVIRTIIAMSHGLGIKVLAEGVETEKQLRFLTRRRCDHAQGFLISHPVPADQFPGAVRVRSAAPFPQTA